MGKTSLGWIVFVVCSSICAQPCAAGDVSVPSEVIAAIEGRRAMAGTIKVMGVTERVRTPRAESPASPDPVTTEVKFSWTVDIKHSRFRLDEVAPMTDPSSGTPLSVESIIGFDGEKAVLWHPERHTMSDGTPLLSASKMSKDNRFVQIRIFGSVFWWLGILDDYGALVSGTPSNLNAYEWRHAASSDEFTAVLREGEHEFEFVFSGEQDYNVTRAIRRLHRNGETVVTSDTTVNYEQKDKLWTPALELREISSGLDSTLFTLWELDAELPIERTRLPQAFLRPGMLVSDDTSNVIQHVTKQGALAPHVPGVPLTRSKLSTGTLILSCIVLASAVLYVIVANRRRN